MNDSRPLVTICIPVFNDHRYLAEAIRSAQAQAQSYPNLEILIVDNASTDGSAEIADEFAGAGVRVFHNPGLLPIEQNWNRCLELAKGQYVTILPSDDALYTDAIARRVTALEEDPEVVFAFSSRDVVDRNGNRIVNPRFFRQGRIAGKTIVSRCVLLATNVIGEPACVTFRKSAADRTDGFDNRLPYVIDLQFWLSLLDQGDAFAYREPQCLFRLTGGNLTYQLGDKRKRDFKEMIEIMSSRSYANVGAAKKTLGLIMADVNEFLRSRLHRRLHNRD